MKIRTRLRVSHVIALIVPILMGILITIIAITGLYLYIARGNYVYVSSLSQYNNASQLLTYVTFKDFRDENHLKYAPILYRIFDPINTYIRVSQDGSPIFYYGNLNLMNRIPPEVLEDEASLRTYSKETVYYTHVTKEIRNSFYTVTLFAINPNGMKDEKLEFFLKSIFVVSVLAVLLTIYLINFFLTRFTMRRIIAPLESLTKGAQEVEKGALNKAYVPIESNDEFKPIMERFNMMIRTLQTNEQDRLNRERSRRELIAGISHDIRTPLTSIKAYVEGLLDGIADSEEHRNKYLQIIQSKTNDMDIMLEQLFLFSKLDVGKEALHIEPIRLHHFLGEYVRDNKEFFHNKGLNISLYVYSIATVLGDYPVMVRILENLLTNSLKYKSEATGHCRITLSTSGANAIITVTDDGPGVPEEKLDRLFEVFYRTDSARANTNEGSGLGLAITAKYVRLLGGHISASNAHPSGLQMTITLPLKDSTDNNTSKHDGSTEGANTTFKGKDKSKNLSQMPPRRKL